MPTHPTLPRILVVDDEPDLRQNLSEWLSMSGYEVQAASNGVEALALARRHDFDVVVTDLKMPYMGGLDLLSLVKERAPQTQVIFLSGQGTMRDAIVALREGRAFDFLEKPLVDLRQLNLVIERALARRPGATAATDGEPATLERLTEREREILGLLVQGLDNRALAERVALSEGTVRNVLSRLYEKLNVENRTQAAILGRRLL